MKGALWAKYSIPIARHSACRSLSTSPRRQVSPDFRPPTAFNGSARINYACTQGLARHVVIASCQDLRLLFTCIWKQLTVAYGSVVHAHRSSRFFCCQCLEAELSGSSILQRMLSCTSSSQVCFFPNSQAPLEERSLEEESSARMVDGSLVASV
jgi:hypothetical protein